MARSIEASWAGGDRGRVTIDRFLERIQKLLNPSNGRAYIVLVDENEPNEIIDIIQRLPHFKAEVRTI